MRNMFKTSTAIIASLSLLSPTLTFAQETAPEQSAEQAQPDQPPVPPKAEPAPKAEAPAVSEPEAPSSEPEAEPEPAPEKPAEMAEEVKTDEAPAKAEAPAEPDAIPPVDDTGAPETPAPAPATTEAETPSQTPAEAEDKAAEQASEAKKAPVAKPTKIETEAPATKPADAAEKGAKAEEAAAEAEHTPPAKPDSSKAVTAEDKPASKAEVSDTEQEPETEAQTDPAASAAEADAMTSSEAASDEKPKPAVTSEEDLRKALEAETAKAEKPVEGTAEPSSEAAPEAAAPETAAAVEAAKAEAPKENEALKMLQERVEGKAQDVEKNVQNVIDFAVTEDDARRSDEDFETSVASSVDEKKDDNKGRDLARLALAGMAGFAVGKMLSNNQKVALNTGDRVVVTNPDGSQQLIKDEDALLFQPGANVQTERFDDGSTITTVARGDGSKVVTIRDANLNILRRSVVYADGSSHMLIDDTAEVKPVQVSTLPPPARPIDYSSQMSEQDLRAALMRESAIDRRFTLGQIRNIAQVRALVAPLDIQSITFDTGSAAISPEQARQLATLGQVIADSVKNNPREVYLIEGYTDAVGSDASNLALSDRRAESVALALTEYFQVPPENMVVQGYGEQFLKVQTQEAERANRRVAVRRITDLIEQR